MSYILSIDAGGGGCKCMLFDLESKKHFSTFEDWSFISSKEDPLLKEFDPDEFFRKICRAVRNILRKARADPKDIITISSSSMRQSYVFLDEHGREIYAGPNVDARGVYYGDLIEERLGEDIYKITGQWPPLIYTLARLLWFREETPEKFKKIRYVLTTNDWIIYRLSGEMVTEPSISSATQLLDIGKRTWREDFLEEFGMDHLELPVIKKTGEVVGSLKEETARKMNLKENIPVVMGGADSQVAMLSCLSFDEGDTSIIAGTSTPVMLTFSKPVIDQERRIWTSCHVLEDRWVLEANAQITGLNYEWMKDMIKEVAGKEDEKIYEIMEKLAGSVRSAHDGFFASLGPEIMDLNRISTLRPGIFLFPQPNHPASTAKIRLGHFVRGILENISFALRANIDLLEEISGEKVKKVGVTGGLTRSNVWLEILSDVLGRGLMVTDVRDGTAFGCIISGAVGAGMYRNLRGAAEDLVTVKNIEPRDSKAYEEGFERWKEIYEKIVDL